MSTFSLIFAWTFFPQNIVELDNSLTKKLFVYSNERSHICMFVVPR